MKKLGICGHFGSHENINGQMVKTRILTGELTKHFGKDEVALVDSFGWKKHPFKLFYKCVGLAAQCRNILIMPAAGGIRVFAPLFSILCRIFNRKLHYSTIGGWLPSFLSENRGMVKYLKMMNTVYVETRSIAEKLSALGLENTIYMPNFKNIKVLDEKDLPAAYSEPYPLCTFSRVKREKGILDAIEALKEFNSREGRTVFSLDVYGSIDEDVRSDFEKAVADNGSFAVYKGVAEYGRTAEVLKDYFALLFPTYYDGEGFPGTIIDAFSSGLPVLATDWLYNSEIVADGETGVIYEISLKDRQSGLVGVLKDISRNPEILTGMKKKCLLEAGKYDAGTVMKVMTERML